MKIKYGSTLLFANSSEVPPSNRTNYGVATCYMIVARAAPGGSANIMTAPITSPDAFCCTGPSNITAQPVAVATNSSQALTVSTQWAGAGTGPNTFTLEALRVREDN